MYHPRANRARILIVDDDHAIRDVFRRLLARAGYDTRGAASAAEALDGVHEWTPDLILLELQMPGMSGVKALEALRAHHCTRDARIIAFSGYFEPWDTCLLRRLGFDGILEKGGELTDTIRRLAQQVHASALSSDSSKPGYSDLH